MTMTPDRILAALHQKLEETFPGEPVYDNFTPRGFQRPSNLLELERTDLDPQSLGMAVKPVRFLLLVLAAALAGAAVSFAGLLSFVGLIVPHAVRRILGEDNLPVLAASILGGGVFVTLCDLLARVLFAPFELPVGIVLAFTGAPFFLWLLLRQKGGRG